jgi:hypothetical protein
MTRDWHPTPEEIAETDRQWATLRIEVVFDPRTGNIKPWELHGVFTYPHPIRKHWASFKTEAAANAAAAKWRSKYPQSTRAA